MFTEGNLNFIVRVLGLAFIVIVHKKIFKRLNLYSTASKNDAYCDAYEDAKQKVTVINIVRKYIKHKPAH